jgi:hypothetical protein
LPEHTNKSAFIRDISPFAVHSLSPLARGGSG